MNQEDRNNLEYAQSLPEEDFDEFVEGLDDDNRNYLQELFEIRDREIEAEMAAMEAKLEPVPIKPEWMIFAGNCTVH